MAGVFINYRRDDTKYVAGRLSDRLRNENFDVFIDVGSIEWGADFGYAIDTALSRSDVLLALIGANWTKHLGKQADGSEDFVAWEVRRALERGIRVIPILVDGANMPRAEDLPADLKPLARRQATRLDYESFDSQADRLVAALGKILAPTPDAAPASEEHLPGDAVPTPAHGMTDEPAAPVPSGPESRWRLIGLVALVVLVLGVVAAILLWPDPGPEGGGDTTSSIPPVRDRLASGNRLDPGDFIATADGRHRLEMTAAGRLVLTTDGVTRWESLAGPPGSWANMQASDGNLVVYAAAEGGAVWASATGGHPGAYLVIGAAEGQGRITIYDRDGRELWHRPEAGVVPSSPTVETTTATTAATTTPPETTVPGTTATPTSS